MIFAPTNLLKVRCVGLPNRQLLNYASQSVADGANGSPTKFYGLEMASKFASDARGARKRHISGFCAKCEPGRLERRGFRQ